MKSSSGDPMAHRYLVQRISVAVQRGNTAAVLGEHWTEGRGLVILFGGVLLWRVFACCVLFLLMFIKS